MLLLGDGKVTLREVPFPLDWAAFVKKNREVDHHHVATADTRGHCVVKNKNAADQKWTSLFGEKCRPSFVTR